MNAHEVDGLPVEEWLQIRKDAGKKINPETAEVAWQHGYTLDPYGVYHDLLPEERQVGRTYFARSPASDIWVSFRDLPAEIRDALWNKH
jgi:hypothetical protein